MAEPLFTLAAPAAAVGSAAAAAAGQQGQQQAVAILLRLACWRQQQQGMQQQPGGSSNQQQRRTLHCCYFWLPPVAAAAAGSSGNGSSATAGLPSVPAWLVISWTDDRAELMQSKLFQIPRPLLAATATMHCSAAAAAAAAVSRWVCGSVLAQTLDFAADLSKNVTAERAVFDRLLICRLGSSLGVGEADAWQGLLGELLNPAGRQDIRDGVVGGTLNTWRSGDDGRAVTARSLVQF
jgi:hypothetical protein